MKPWQRALKTGKKRIMKAARFFWTGVAALCIVSGVMGVLIDHNSRLQPAAQEATDEVFQPKLTASAPLPLTHPNTSAQEIRTTTTLPPEHTQTARLVLFIQSDAIADLQVSAGSGPLSLIKSEVEQTDGGYRVFTEFTGLNQDEAYADSNQSLTLSFHTTQPESITVSIETGSSFLLTDTTKYAYNPYSHTFPIKEVQPASPSPTPASQSPAPTTHPYHPTPTQPARRLLKNQTMNRPTKALVLNNQKTPKLPPPALCSATKYAAVIATVQAHSPVGAIVVACPKIHKA
ncbi:MAG: hypothetical protein H6774_02385 [Pseudomonadales bacterium]|nr:hypothetical protein [Pseudomonadales bacterium]